MEDRTIRIDANNIETQHICCAIGDDAANRRRAATKKAWLKSRFKGMGFARRLLDGCLAEARAANRAGIAVVTSSTPKPFLTEKSFFTAHGFKVVDTAPPYFELIALALDPKAAPPRHPRTRKPLRHARHLPRRDFCQP